MFVATLVPLLCEYEEDIHVIFDDSDHQQIFNATSIGTPAEMDSGGYDPGQ